MKKIYNKPALTIVEHKGSVIMLNTSGGGTGGVVTPPRSKENDYTDYSLTPTNLWDGEEEE